VDEGVEPDDARRMVAETLAGTGALLHRHPADKVRRTVASPGGVTEAALEALEKHKFRKALDRAVKTSLEKMRG
jgi:pyrroline-5-carboxylate reductase